VQHVSEDENLLQIAISPGDDGPVVHLSGELDPHTAPLLADAVTPYHADENTKQVVLDLEQLRFIDSSGLRVIIASEQALRERGARLVLRSPSEATRRLLEITDLLGRLDVE
jgi:anti-anti-sigma factor